ncbi:MAG: hypothetical protein A2X12_03800 [Bacteroidetes bacterium GWE2_29_8]|nr:MAG: hypothetical protein A2X12_03800 [Bacteroidetes bacterium GWE2_29_8]
MFGAIETYAQSKNKLEANKNQIEKDIKYINRLLNETKKNKQVSLGELLLLNTQISSREKLMNNINYEIGIIERTIIINIKEIKNLEDQLNKLKEEYKKILEYSLMTRNSYNKIVFLFSSKSFYQAFKRLKYMQSYSEYRIKQAELIKQTQTKLTNKINELTNKKTEKKSLLNQNEQEKIKLDRVKVDKNNAIKSLQKKEKELIASLKEKEKNARALQKAIEKIIADEMAKAEKERKLRESKKEKETGTKAPDVKKSEKNLISYSMTPEETIFSTNFAKNKGSLPWPVEKGVITSSFGEHSHPVLKDVKTMNNGIDIGTSNGTEARAVFEGKVSGVIMIPGANKAVIIRHGNYLSVYSNLKDVYVKMGDNVKIKQNIGKVFFDEENSKTELHFEIWKDNIRLNPAHWIAR